MAQTTSGLRAALSHPIVYDVLQSLMGAKKARAEFVENFVRPQSDACILDLGCGTADILTYLPDNARYHGYDISAHYIAAARTRFGYRGSFFCGEFDRFALADSPAFDIVVAIGVLHHLDDGDAAGMCKLACDALKPDGRLVTIDPCFANDQNLFARFLISRDRGRNVRTPDGYQALTRGAFRTVHGVLRHRRWIPYTHWIMESSP